MAAEYAAHGPRLGRIAYLLTGDAQLAQDLVQETFSRAFARRRVLRRGDEAMAGYLRATLVNLTRKHWRSRQRERAALERHAHVAPTGVSQPDIDDRDR